MLFAAACSPTHSPTHSLTTHSLTHSLTHPPTLTYSGFVKYPRAYITMIPCVGILTSLSKSFRRTFRKSSARVTTITMTSREEVRMHCPRALLSLSWRRQWKQCVCQTAQECEHHEPFFSSLPLSIFLFSLLSLLHPSSLLPFPILLHLPTELLNTPPTPSHTHTLVTGWH